MRIELVKPSQHGLGHLLNPTDPDSDDRDWIGPVWRGLLDQTRSVATAEPEWLDLPAVSRLTNSSPHFNRLFGKLNEGKSYSERIKPFNFVLIAFVAVHERPADDQEMVLIAPYSNDPARWQQMRWINRYSGRTYQITTEPSNAVERPGLVTVKTYRDIFAAYATNPEPKSADPGGTACHRQTVGLLQRRHVHARTISHIGKEANRLEDAQAGLVSRQGEILNAYDDPELLHFREAVLPKLRELGVREVARRTGHSVAAVHAVLAGRAQPRADSRVRYLKTL